MSLPALALRRPVTVSMVCVCLLVLGFIAARLLPLEMFPEFDAPIVFVQVPYPNATPAEVERDIVRPLEETLATIPGIQRIRSWSQASSGRVLLEFRFGEDVAFKAVEVRDRLEAAREQLPADVRQIRVFKWATGDAPVLDMRVSSSTRDLLHSYELLNRMLLRRIERVPGVSRVELGGVYQPRVHIDLRADRLAAHQIDISALQQALQQANFSISAGRQTLDGQRWHIKPVGEFVTVQDFSDFIVNQQGLRLGELADIRMEPSRPTHGQRLNGQPSVGLRVYKERGANLVQLSQDVLQAIDEIINQPEMLGIDVYPVQNQASSVTTSLRDLLFAGLLGGLLSLIVLYLFLRNFRLTLVIAMAVPISLTVALGGLYFAGLSLNILTMMGMMLAIGMLVDNAVVVSESILAERERSPADATAIERGASSVSVAVIAGTLTTAIVFVPNIFGELTNISLFLRDVAITICLALGASLLLAQTMIPVIARQLPVRPARDGDWMARLRALYARYLAWSVVRRWRMLLVLLLLMASVFIPFRGVGFSPGGNAEQTTLSLRYNLDAEYPLDVVASAVDRIESWLLEHKQALGIEAVLTFYNETGQAHSTLVFADGAPDIASVRQQIRDEMPAIAIGSPSFEWQPNRTDRLIRVNLYGDATEDLLALIETVSADLQRLDSVAAVVPDSVGGDQQVLLSVHRDRSVALGISASEVGTTVASAMRGAQLRELAGEMGEIPVRFGFREADSERLDQLADLRIPRADGEAVSLAAITDWRVMPGPRSINRTDRQTAIALEIELAEQGNPGEARMQVTQLLNAVSWPDGYGWRFGQAIQQDMEDQRAMLVKLLMAIVFIFMVMAALFESLIRPFAILSTIAFAVIGTWWFFYITGTDMSVIAMIGMLVLVGVVVNNGIVLIDHINRFRWQGMARGDAIVLAGSERLRPILLTSATTIIGMLPLAFGDTRIGGEGPPYYPMARAVVGGLTFSTVFSLLLLPMVYVLVEDGAAWLRMLWRRAAGRSKASADA